MSKKTQTRFFLLVSLTPYNQPDPTTGSTITRPCVHSHLFGDRVPGTGRHAQAQKYHQMIGLD